MLRITSAPRVLLCACTLLLGSSLPGLCQGGPANPVDPTTGTDPSSSADTSADPSAGPSADPGQAPAATTPPPNPQSRTIAGTARPPAPIPITAGVTTTPLPYRYGDVENTTGTASLSEKFNETLPKWLRFSGEIRDRIEGYENSGFKPNSSDFYDLYRMKLGLLIQPAKWIKLFIATADERVFAKSPAIPPYQNTWDIKQAYAELGETEGNGFGLRVGRQELYFGNGRFIGNSWWSNVSRTFDAVRGSYQRGDYRIDAFISSVVISRDGVVDHHNQGNNLSGLYGTIKNKVAPKSQIEPFVFWHVQNGATLKNGKLGHLDQWTGGVRFLGVLPGNFDYRTEMAIQRGELGPSDIRAWTGHWVMGNTIPVAWKPRPFIEYNFASGDPNSKNLATTQTFDPIYPSTHDKIGLLDQAGWRNIKDLRVGLDTHPASKWATNLDFHDLWLANAHDSFYPTRGSVVAKDLTGKSGTHIGEEVDAQVIYKHTQQFQVGAGIGRLFDGEFLKKTTKGKDYMLPYVLLDYVF